jgi:Transglutaminase-like superfamily
VSTIEARSTSWYAEPAPMTDVPADVPAVADVRAFVQGCLIHTIWAPAYGVEKVRDRRQTRTTKEMLDAVKAIDARPLDVPREPIQRAGVVCRHFSTLAVALLRRDGVAARARCGFATYFEPEKYVDHWIVEQYDGSRWVQRDFQLDSVQLQATGASFDPDNLPTGAFLTGGEAWRRIRSGQADAGTFGIFDMWGAWFAHANLVRDLAALRKVEMLPWDTWGCMVTSEDAIDESFADEIATVTIDGDLDTVRQAYADERVRMPGKVLTFTPEGPREESVEAGTQP